MTPPRCPHCGAVATDPVGEMLAAIKAGRVAELSPEQIVAAFHAGQEPAQAERLRIAFEKHERR